MKRWGIKPLEKCNLKVVDLFCGAGIGASGIKMAGFDIVWAIDKDKYAVKTYNENIDNHAICADIRKIYASDIPKHDIMVATPVCKSFSVAGSQEGFENKDTGDLTYHFTRLLRDCNPKAFLFENVAGMITKNHIDEFLNIVDTISSYGYKVKWKVINCYDYGVPQERKRLFMVGIRNDIKKEFEFPEKSEVKTDIRYAIEDIKDNKSIPNNDTTLELGYSSRYMSRNRQRQWNEPSFTICSEARHLPLYPEPANYDIRVEDINVNKPPRRFTVRECLRLQTVPDSFKFSKDIPLKKQYERCSGIPSLMAYKLINEIKNTIL